MKEIQEHKIKIYEFPETDDEEEMKMVRKIKVAALHEVFNETVSVVFSVFGFMFFMLCVFVCEENTLRCIFSRRV